MASPRTPSSSTRAPSDLRQIIAVGGALPPSSLESWPTQASYAVARGLVGPGELQPPLNVARVFARAGRPGRRPLRASLRNAEGLAEQPPTGIGQALFVVLGALDPGQVATMSAVREVARLDGPPERQEHRRVRQLRLAERA